MFRLPFPRGRSSRRHGDDDIAGRDDLDLLVHLGDYIYDFVDEDEQIRIPLAFPEEPFDLDSWRQRHQDYLADPDLRRARAALPCPGQ